MLALFPLAQPALQRSRSTQQVQSQFTHTHTQVLTVHPIVHPQKPHAQSHQHPKHHSTKGFQSTLNFSAKTLQPDPWKHKSGRPPSLPNKASCKNLGRGEVRAELLNKHWQQGWKNPPLLALSPSPHMCSLGGLGQMFLLMALIPSRCKPWEPPCFITVQKHPQT